MANEEDYPTSIRLPREIKKALDAEAIEQKRPRTFIILEILQQWFAFHSRQKADKKLRANLKK